MISLKNEKNLLTPLTNIDISDTYKISEKKCLINRKYLSSEIISSNLNKDLLQNFRKHFAKILSRKFKTYLFRKKVCVFLKRIRSINKFVKIFSKYKIRDFTNKLIEKIIKIQKYTKLINFKNKIMRLYNKSKKVVNFRIKIFNRFLKSQIKLKEKIRGSYIRKLNKLKKNIFSKSKQKIQFKFQELTSSGIAKNYYEKKIKIKLLVKLFLN